MYKYKITIFLIILFLPVITVHAQHFDSNYFEDDPVNFYFQIGDVDDDGDPEYLESGSGEVAGAIVLGDRDPRLIIAGVINLILGFLGIIALILIIMSGFKYMLSSGNQDESNAAINMLLSAIVGLIIILSAYGIARFIISSLMGATT